MPADSPEKKFVQLKIVVAAAFILSVGLSWRLWTSLRLFPLSPVSDFLPAVPSFLSVIWFCLLLGLLGSIMLVRWPRGLIVIFLVLAGLLALWDQERWQPWFFEYLFLLAAIGLYKRGNAASGELAALNASRLIVACLYLWSGLQKLNVNFIRETWPDIAAPVLRFLPQAKKVPAAFILIIPLLEILIGMGLITRRFRNLAVVFAMATHLVILAMLISSGENTVVWPWNVAMALLAVLLFWRQPEAAPAAILVPRNAFHWLVLLLFGVLPALSFFDLWDSYLSSALYSGNTDQAVIYLSPAAISLVPAELHPHIWQSNPPFFLDVNRWAYGELNVPLYPEPRIYRRIATQVCQYAGSSAEDVRLRIKKKPNLLTGARESEYYDCDHLSF